LDAAGRTEVGAWVAGKAVWTQRGASKWIPGWQGKQLGRSGAHRSGLPGDPGSNCDAAGRIEVDFWVSQKWLKTKTHEGQRQGAQEVHKRESDLDLPGCIEMDFRVSTKRESRGTAEGKQPGTQRVTQPPAPPVVSQLSDSF
jgi:hypothetical protein